ncbi:conserved hypothetical protein [Desulfofarcimen acetoxidans DSM 771]|uniref:DUF362 domain-containing protein n=2 Tax=Desulfofarcimen acetoxidans TaxID=58138 RepID=C8W0G4_DESAS|nr:conserved hypothetical protein [Desulfofarcimen acetoxidans DSM 771]
MEFIKKRPEKPNVLNLGINFPQMITIKQNLPRQGLDDVRNEVRRILAESRLEQKLRPGAKVAITAGSRGIANIALIIRETVDYLKRLNTKPFVLAAMGSHGGGTIQGQLKVLADLGITSESIGAPIMATVETVITGSFAGIAVHISQLAYESDAVILINRVKPHTSFHGPNESGLVKMLAVGLGGPLGAAAIHATGVSALSHIIPGVASVMQKHLNIALGLAIIEDAYESTKKIVSVPVENIASEETILLQEAYEAMPRLPVNNLDLLIVEEMGKCFSGTGMDTNIIGRMRIQGIPEPPSPAIKRIVVLNLATASHGNAYGLGLADFTTRQLVNKIDFEVTYLNAVTSTFVQRAMIPMTLPTEKAAIEAAVNSLGIKEISQIRIARLRNTLHITELQVSENLLEEISSTLSIDIMGLPNPLQFNSNGNLYPFLDTV